MVKFENTDSKDFLLHRPSPHNASKKRRTRAEMFFVYAMLALPILNFIVTYVLVNVNSFLLAFQSYDSANSQYYFSGFENFIRFFKDTTNEPVLKKAISNSFINYAIGICFGLPTSIISAYFIYKKLPFSGGFVVILFLPNIISSMVFVLVYKYFLEYIIPEIFGNDTMVSLLLNPDTSFWMLIIYSQWLGFAGGLLLYTGAMSRIPESLSESARLEGCGALRELWHITLPMIFPTISVFLVLGIAGIFTNNLSAYAFYREQAPFSTYTIGYYLFIKVFGQKSSLADYSYAAAAGMSYSLIAAPLTIFVKNLLAKYGPTVEY